MQEQTSADVSTKGPWGTFVEASSSRMAREMGTGLSTFTDTFKTEVQRELTDKVTALTTNLGELLGDILKKALFSAALWAVASVCLLVGAGAWVYEQTGQPFWLFMLECGALGMAVAYGVQLSIKAKAKEAAEDVSEAPAPRRSPADLRA